MIRRPPRSTRTDTLFPYTTLFRSELGQDRDAYTKLLGSLLEDWPGIAGDVLGPFRFPDPPVKMARFGLKAFRTAAALSRRFSTERSRGLWAGMAEHSFQPMDAPVTSAIGSFLLYAGHL